MATANGWVDVREGQTEPVGSEVGEELVDDSLDEPHRLGIVVHIVGIVGVPRVVGVGGMGAQPHVLEG